LYNSAYLVCETRSDYIGSSHCDLSNPIRPGAPESAMRLGHLIDQFQTPDDEAVLAELKRILLIRIADLEAMRMRRVIPHRFRLSNSEQPSHPLHVYIPPHEGRDSTADGFVCAVTTRGLQSRIGDGWSANGLTTVGSDVGTQSPSTKCSSVQESR